MNQEIRRFWRDEDGATAVEYALIAGLVAIALIGALTAFGEDLGSFFERIGAILGGEAPPTTPGEG